MNYSEKYLIEAAWNEIAKEVGSIGRKRTRSDVNKQLIEKDMLELQRFLNNKDGFSFNLHIPAFHKDSNNKEDRAQIEIRANAIFFYYINDFTNQRIYIKNIDCLSIDVFNKFISLIRGMYIEQIGAMVEVRGSSRAQNTKSAIIDIADFNDLTVLGVDLKNVIVQNVNVDYEWFKDDTFKDIRNTIHAIESKSSDFKMVDNIPLTLYAKFYECVIGNNVNIQKAHTVHLSGSYDYHDLTFIKDIKSYMYFSTFGRDTYPDRMNLYGLPNGDYKLKVTLGKQQYEDSKLISFNDDDQWTFEGIPDSISELEIYTCINPKKLFPHFSFKGIPIPVVDKTALNVYVGARTNVQGTIRCGYKELNARTSYWKVNRKDLMDVLVSNDFFLDFWTKNSKPNREYIPPQQSEEYKERVKKLDYKKYDANKRIEEDKANIEFLKQRIKKYLKVGEKYPFKPNKDGDYDSYLIIISMDDNEIEWKEYYREGWKWEGNWRVMSEAKYTYEKFIEYKLHSEYMINGKTFEQFFTKYAHKRLLKIREERRKKDRAKEKAKEKGSQQAQEKPVKIRKKKEFNFDEQLGKKKEQPAVQKRDDIEVVDYKERSYAVFGNTYDIKDQLKELGAYYNKFLSYDGRKRPGWIVSKKKKTELEKIIGPF